MDTDRHWFLEREQRRDCEYPGVWFHSSALLSVLQSKLPQYTFPIWFISAASLTFISLCRCSNSHPRHHQHHWIKTQFGWLVGAEHMPLYIRANKIIFSCNTSWLRPLDISTNEVGVQGTNLRVGCYALISHSPRHPHPTLQVLFCQNIFE